MINVLVVRGDFSTIQTREKVANPGASPGLLQGAFRTRIQIR